MGLVIALIVGVPIELFTDWPGIVAGVITGAILAFVFPYLHARL